MMLNIWTSERLVYGGGSGVSCINALMIFHLGLLFGFLRRLCIPKEEDRFWFCNAYDDKPKPVEPRDWAYIKLAKGIGTGHTGLQSSQLCPVKQGPFRIKRRVGRLAYELELPPSWRMHLVISVIHLKQAYLEDVHSPGLTDLPKKSN
jgi:hypothetical protein